MTQWKFDWVNSVKEISRNDWRNCFGEQNVINSYEYQQAVEDSQPQAVDFYYLMAKKQGEIQAIIGCFHYRLPVAILAGENIRWLIDSLAKISDKFSYFNAFFVGHLTAVCDHLFGLQNLKRERQKQLLDQSQLVIATKAKELKCSIVAVKEIAIEDIDFFRSALGRYLFVHSLPNTFLHLSANQSYQQQIRSKYKYLYRQRKKEFNDAGLTFEVQDNCREIAGRFEQLYRRVLSKSKHQFEQLDNKLFAEMGKVEQTFFIVCKKDKEVLGFSMNIEGKDRVYGIYLGYDDQQPGHIYFNLLYQLIDETIRREKKLIQFGQTSYDVKIAMGAVISERFLGIYSPKRWLSVLLPKIKNHLFPIVEYPARNVMKQRRK